MDIKRCRDFTREQDYGSFAAVRVFNGCLKELGGRHAWVTIKNGNRKIFRRAMGAAGTGIRRDDIELDYDSRLELGISGHLDSDGFYDCVLKIQQSSISERLQAHWRHPSLSYQVPFRLAMLSLLLGGIGLILGIVSLLK